MSKILRYFILISFAIFSFSCKTDFNPNAPYQDITVVYGLLSQNDSISYIKINKAFLGSANAYVMAQNPDSSSYGNNLDVKVQRWVNGYIDTIYQFDTTTIYNKEPGIFYYPNQVVYRCRTNYTLDPSKLYNLVITNKLTGKVVTSSTPLVGSFTITEPGANDIYINFSKTGQREVTWTSAPNGRLYQVTIRFNYSETNTLNNTTVQKYIDWIFPNQQSMDLNGGDNMEVDYYGSGFYQLLKSNIAVNPNVTRTAGKVEIIITVGADQLSTYIDVNAPSQSIVQITPQYTNINNGIGLFSSRYDNHLYDPLSLYLDAYSVDSLLYGQYTYNLGFK